MPQSAGQTTENVSYSREKFRRQKTSSPLLLDNQRTPDIDNFYRITIRNTSYSPSETAINNLISK